jgi:hypothetical protein
MNVPVPLPENTERNAAVDYVYDLVGKIQQGNDPTGTCD